MQRIAKTVYFLFYILLFVLIYYVVKSAYEIRPSLNYNSENKPCIYSTVYKADGYQLLRVTKTQKSRHKYIIFVPGNNSTHKSICNLASNDKLGINFLTLDTRSALTAFSTKYNDELTSFLEKAILELNLNTKEILFVCESAGCISVLGLKDHVKNLITVVGLINEHPFPFSRELVAQQRRNLQDIIASEINLFLSISYGDNDHVILKELPNLKCKNYVKIYSTNVKDCFSTSEHKNVMYDVRLTKKLMYAIEKAWTDPNKYKQILNNSPIAKEINTRTLYPLTMSISTVEGMIKVKDGQMAKVSNSDPFVAIGKINSVVGGSVYESQIPINGKIYYLYIVRSEAYLVNCFVFPMGKRVVANRLRSTVEFRNTIKVSGFSMHYLLYCSKCVFEINYNDEKKFLQEYASVVPGSEVTIYTLSYQPSTLAYRVDVFEYLKTVFLNGRVKLVSSILLSFFVLETLNDLMSFFVKSFFIIVYLAFSVTINFKNSNIVIVGFLIASVLKAPLDFLSGFFIVRILLAVCLHAFYLYNGIVWIVLVLCYFAVVKFYLKRGNSESIGSRMPICLYLATILEFVMAVCANFQRLNQGRSLSFDQYTSFKYSFLYLLAFPRRNGRMDVYSILALYMLNAALVAYALYAQLGNLVLIKHIYCLYNAEVFVATTIRKLYNSYEKNRKDSKTSKNN